MTAASSPVGIGIIGCGNISGIYLKNLARYAFLEVRAVADVDLLRAEAKASEYGVKACTVAELLADPSLDIVVNLTVPRVHAEVSMAVLEAGKSVYSEKPLAVTRDEGRALLEAAERRGLRVGCAPDTFLGAGLQTCRKVIDDGWIGRPIGATAFMMNRGPESWHPDPESYYRRGAGSMFDMGPYYLTALVNLMGPIRRVTGSEAISFEERLITSRPRAGTTFKVEAATFVAGVMEFSAGGLATFVTSYDVWASELPRMEIYGSEGTLSVPDPNFSDGPVRLRRAGAEAWSELPLSHPYTGNSRGLGVADMAQAMRRGRPHRASGELAFHILDAMTAFYEAATQGVHVILGSSCERPTSLPLNLSEGALD